MIFRIALVKRRILSKMVSMLMRIGILRVDLRRRIEVRY